MSWSIDKTYSTVDAAQRGISNENYLPTEVKSLIFTALAGLGKNTYLKVDAVAIKGNGHTHNGSTEDYTTTSCQLTVVPISFADPAVLGKNEP